MAAIGAGLLVFGRTSLSTGTVCACILFLIYGCRLGGYLAFRELKSSSYNTKMKMEIKSGKGMSTGAKSAIWGSAALLYACETSPVIFRISNGRGTDSFLAAGMIVSDAGLLIESMEDLQKNAAKK
ncbi:MAG: steroid reductase, partial [Lachnospiraceae bacterium]|nr:steroid reductase [Lachnospiraceae bacterium]